MGGKMNQDFKLPFEATPKICIFSRRLYFEIDPIDYVYPSIKSKMEMFLTVLMFS